MSLEKINLTYDYKMVLSELLKSLEILEIESLLPCSSDPCFMAATTPYPRKDREGPIGSKLRINGKTKIP